METESRLITVGDHALFCEDNVRIKVEVLNIKEATEDGITVRHFKLRALSDQNEPHYLCGHGLKEGDEFGVGFNVKYAESPYRGWRFEAVDE